MVEAAKEAIDKLQGDDDDDEEPQKVNKPAVKKSRNSESGNHFSRNGFGPVFPCLIADVRPDGF